jgi:hypothetical protein
MEEEKESAGLSRANAEMKIGGLLNQDSNDSRHADQIHVLIPIPERGSSFKMPPGNLVSVPERQAVQVPQLVIRSARVPVWIPNQSDSITERLHLQSGGLPERERAISALRRHRLKTVGSCATESLVAAEAASRLCRTRSAISLCRSPARRVSGRRGTRSAAPR